MASNNPKRPPPVRSLQRHFVLRGPEGVAALKALLDEIETNPERPWHCIMRKYEPAERVPPEDEIPVKLAV